MKLNIILFALFSIQIGLAQERTINGTVFSEGKPLNGASLRIKGSNLGTITDENGNFLIKFFEKRNNQLIISLFVVLTVNSWVVHFTDEVTVVQHFKILIKMEIAS